jgi:uncharacterized protein
MPVDLQTEQTGVGPDVFEAEPLSTPAVLETPAPRVEPVAAEQRHFSVDVMRGFALLGILAMNIVGFGWPEAAYDNPFRGGGFQGLDRVVWYFNHLFFEMKMMTIFSMLFGAGLVLMDQRAEKRGVKIRGVYYRRIFWLLVIGCVHAYLIWWGDILVLYAQCGLYLYLFRNLKPTILVILGTLGLFLVVPFFLGIGAGVDYTRTAAARYEANVKAGEKHTGLDHMLHDYWVKGMRDGLDPDSPKKAEAWEKNLKTYRGGYWTIVKERAPRLFGQHIAGFFILAPLLGMGRMLLGMGLMKFGVFSAQRSRRFYLWMVGLGYGIGIPLMIFDANKLIQSRFSAEYELHGGILYNFIGSVVVALGHIGLLALIVQSGAISWLTRRLAAVGRMALSNYLTHSIVCTTLFYGYGFGLFGHVNRAALAGIVLLIWVFQLWMSPIWLRHFRFGPAEWVWRSLTYWRLQPMRVEPAAQPAIG